MRTGIIFAATFLTVILAATAFAQGGTTGTIHGTVRLEPTGTPARNVVVTIAELRKRALTDQNGEFEFKDIPAAKYQIIAHLDRVPDIVRTVEVKSGNQRIDFQLTLAPVSEQVNVTA